MRRTLSLVAAVCLGVAAGACFDEGLTLDLECESGADCAPSQKCLQTPHQLSLQLAGWCRPEDGACSEGKQPGCECSDTQGCSAEPGTPTLTAVTSECVSAAQADLADCIAMEALEPMLNDCFCVVAPATGT